MEEGRAEQRVPAQRDRSARHEVRPTQLPICHRDRRCRRRRPRARGFAFDPRELALEPLGKRNVVRIEPRNVAAGRLIEARFSEAASPTCSCCGARPDGGRRAPAADSAVSSVEASSIDDQLEVPRSARARCRSPRGGSARRHARPGERKRAARAVSVRPWTTRGFLSTSSSRLSTASRELERLLASLERRRTRLSRPRRRPERRRTARAGRSSAPSTSGTRLAPRREALARPQRGARTLAPSSSPFRTTIASFQRICSSGSQGASAVSPSSTH